MSYPTSMTISGWFKAAKPKPTERDLRTQTGVHFEEVAEMLEEIQGNDSTTQAAIDAAYKALCNLAEMLKRSQEFGDFTIKSHINFLDSLCDQQVTAIGVGVYAGYKIDAALDEVNRSNWSKFDDQGEPILDPNGKIMKGQDYWKPALESYIPEQQD